MTIANTDDVIKCFNDVENILTHATDVPNSVAIYHTVTMEIGGDRGKHPVSTLSDSEKSSPLKILT